MDCLTLTASLFWNHTLTHLLWSAGEHLGLGRSPFKASPPRLLLEGLADSFSALAFSSRSMVSLQLPGQGHHHQPSHIK